ncbi:MAG: lectin [Winogradskyella sp.]|uniref:T9SS type B sorting domain-containing protein n=1 Tax=Winogradskyella sp. TaxID=1883156 RepID=UPI000F3CB937|nr:T9SS type B sorting domain-containing protein [Winogradskyella sp.]RNC85052.1 MAG: lectin [Winogradskyella sp.]
MKKCKFIFFLLCCTVVIQPTIAQDSPPEINAVGNQNYCGSSTPIATSVSIVDPDATDTTLDLVSIQISIGYAEGFDQLTLTEMHPNIVPMWLPDLGILQLSGPATFTEYEAAILDVEFSTTQVDFNSNRSFSINLGNANYLPSTDHYYFYVASIGVPWNIARDQAASLDFFGLQGYLATITTQEEAQLTGEQAKGAGWIGASDAGSEGVWQWVTGPEAGTQFWQGDFSGFPISFSFWNIGEPNNFDGDEDYAHITDPSIGLLGSWNDLPAAGNPDPNNPFHPKGYIVEFGGMPGDPDISLSAATTLTMPVLEVFDFIGCDNDTFNLTVDSNLEEIIWFDDSLLTNQVNIGDTYDIVLNTTTTFYVVGRFSDCTETLNGEFTVTVNPLPEAVDTIIEQCDDPSEDGISFFVLNDYASIISNGSSVNNVIMYGDAALTQPLNMLNYENTSNGQIVYAQVINPNTNCFRVATVTLSVRPPTDQTYSLEVCDDDVEDGLAEFNLSDLNDDVLLGFPVASQVSYFSSFEGAAINNNPLPNNYTNNIPNTETIFAKVSLGVTCLSINEVFLTVSPLLELRPDETVYYCTDTFPIPITLDAGVVNGTPNNFLYNWSTGETTIQIQVNEIGAYFVDVTEIDGCTNRRTITVLPSNIAEINVDIEDAIDNNNIVVNTTGEGDYEFSLTSENGPYQDSNTFENVRSGIRTVYVRDKNGCGVVAESFPVIGFPKFFTPNGDATNDFWTVDGFNEEFLSNSRVQIFNRHGKLLTELSAENPFWDGMYNGNLMPSDDYWFTVTFQDGRSFSKHFALKR